MAAIDSPRERVIQLLRTFQTDRPLPEAETIPSAWYTDPAFARAEERAVFNQQWLYVGRAEQLQEPGDFFTIQLAGEPLVVLLDERGMLRAYSNVCRHRGAQVLNETCGRATKLRCRYHGWTYDLQGQLRGTPEFAGVEKFDRETQGLPEFPIGACGPYLFVWLEPNPPKTADVAQAAPAETPAPATAAPRPRPGKPGMPAPPLQPDEGPKMSLQDFINPLRSPLIIPQLQNKTYVASRTYELACNWKVFVDNYLDGGYHVNTVHPSLAGVLDYSEYVTQLFDYCSVQTSPMRAPQSGSDDTSAAAVRIGDCAYYWWIFPNFMINIYGPVVDTNWVLPLGPDRCRVIFDFYFEQTEGPAAQAFIQESMAVSDQIQLEDHEVCEEVQRGLASRYYDTGRYSVSREIGVYHFHQMLAKTMRRYFQI